MIPEELGLPGSDELQRAKREAEQFDRLQKLDREFDAFWERIEIQSGTPTRAAALEVPAPFAANVGRYQAPDEFVDDELQPLKDFIKGARAELRGPITSGQIREKLGALGEVMRKVASGL